MVVECSPLDKVVLLVLDIFFSLMVFPNSASIYSITEAYLFSSEHLIVSEIIILQFVLVFHLKCKIYMERELFHLVQCYYILSSRRVFST